MVVPSEASTWVTEREILFTGAPISSYMESGMADQIAQVKGVKRVTEQFFGQTIAAECCSTGKETRIIGFDPASDWVILPFADHRVDHLDEGEIIVGHYANTFPDGTGKLLGHDVKVVAQLVETGSNLDYSILMDIDQLRAISGENEAFQHIWDKYGEPEGLISTVLVDLDDDAVSSLTINEIRRLGDISAFRRSDVVADSRGTLDVVFTIMLAAGIFLAIATLLQFVARFISSVWERKSELALYRALGATVSKLKVAICGEAFAITGVGSLCGAVLGIGLYYLAYAFLQRLDAFPFSAVPVWMAALFIIGIILVCFAVALLSVIAPLRQVARIDPASAMQQVDIG